MTGIQRLALVMIISMNAGILFGQTGGYIRGVVKDGAGRGTLAGVAISIKELRTGTQSGPNGEYQLNAPAGSYTVVYSLIGYATLEKKVKVTAGQSITVAPTLSVSATSLRNVTVEATRVARSEKVLLDLRRKSAVIQDAIGAEQIEKTASITTAQALQRVTGVSVRDGKYITVRGLTDRNLVVQLNGSRLSSANAERSAVPLDIIPAQLLENITVEKTVTPDKPGDATGAIIEIKTKSIPESYFYQVSVQSGFNSNIGIGGYYNSYPDAGLGFLGQKVQNLNLSSAYRSLVGTYEARGYSVPAGTLRGGLVKSIGEGNQDADKYSQLQRIDRAAKSFSPYLTPRPTTSGVNQIYNVTYGNRFALRGDRLIGIVLGLNYYKRFQANPEGVNNLYSLREVSTSSPNISIPNEVNLIPIFKYLENTGDVQLNYGGLATVAYRLNRTNEISVSYNGNFGAEALASTLIGVNNSTLIASNPNYTPLVRIKNSVYDLVLHSTERSLHTFQAKGEHRLGDLEGKALRFSWSASSSHARQNDPDYRNTRILLDSLGQVINNFQTFSDKSPFISSDYAYTFNVKANSYYRSLLERNVNFKGDLVIPATVLKYPATLKMGTYYYQRKRDYTESVVQRLDSGILVPNNSVAGLGQPVGNLTRFLGDVDAWNSPANTGVIQLRSGEGTPFKAGFLPVAEAGSNNYKASLRVLAFYGMGDFRLGKNWRVLGGLRIEGTDIRSNPDTVGTGYARYPGTTQRILAQEDYDNLYVTNYLTYNWLPSGSLIYTGFKKLNFRLAYSSTLTRPELNEIIQSSQNDPIQQAIIQGNKNVKNGQFTSYDFRVDIFPRSEELISFSLFYKQIKDQIERLYLPSAQRLTGGVIATGSSSQYDQYGDASSIISFRNNPNLGFVYGVEFEVRKKLDQVFPFGKYIILGSNLLLSRSTTKLASSEYYIASLFDRHIAGNRPLIDQPSYALNFNAGFDQPKWGSQLNILYNKTGKRLILVNVDGTPNIYEIAAPTFDITFSQKLGKHFQVKAFAKNILNEQTQYVYTTPANTLYYGTLRRISLNRAFAYGSEYTLGVNLTF